MEYSNIEIHKSAVVAIIAKEVDEEINDNVDQRQNRGGHDYGPPAENATGPYGQPTEFGNPPQGYYVFYPTEGNNAGRNPYGGEHPGHGQPAWNVNVDEDYEPFAPNFGTQSIRNAFIRKVYLILSAQLLCFFGIVAIFVFEPHVRESARRNIWAYIIPGLLLFMIPYFTLVCNGQLRRKVPINFCLLFVMTLGLALEGATMSALYNTYIVIVSFAVVSVVCLLITAAAWINIFDMTKYRAYLFVASCLALLLVVIYLIMSFIMRSRTFEIIVTSIMTVLLAAYLMHDTQLIIGGKKHKYEISAEDYILGAVLLYVDIAHMFLYVLMLIGLCGRNS